MKKILYVVEDRCSAQFRYRVKNVIECLDDSKKWSAEWVTCEKIDNIAVESYEFFVILRQTAKDDVLLNFIDKVHRAGKKVFYDLDDLIFDYRDLPLLMSSTNSKNVFYWIGYFWGIRRIAKKVDGFIVTNDFLAKKIRRSFDKSVRVIRNSLNDEQIRVSNKWIEKKKDKNELEKVVDNKSRQFKIGYFSGSPTHVKDFRLIEAELARFLQLHEDAVMKVVGYMEFSGEMKKMIEGGRVEVIGVVDYLRLQGLISKVDVNIAPLEINDFTNCKSELKFFEAAAVETVTIASPTYTFKKAIDNGENGFLAKPGEWYDKLEFLYDNPEERQKIAKAARVYALEHYHGKKFLKEVEMSYDSFAK